MRLPIHAIPMAALLLTTACNHKELIWEEPLPETSVEILFDWSDAPEAEVAATRAVMFFNLPSGEAADIPFDFDNPIGGPITAPVGEYHFSGHNADTPSTLFDGFGNRQTLRAYTPQTDLTSDGNLPDVVSEPVYACPDMLYVGNTVDSVRPNRHNIIVIRPRQLTCVYTYEVRNVSNLDNVESVSAALTGMSHEVRHHDGNLSSQGATLPFATEINLPRGESGSLSGRFLTFGHHPDVANTHRLLLFVRMKDGRKIVLGPGMENFDVSSQVDNAPDRLRVHIVIDNLNIDPDPSDPSVSVLLSADGWQVFRYNTGL